jgi:transposase
MKNVSVLGIDLAKNIFQLHGINSAGDTVIKRKLKRSQLIAYIKKLPSCLIGIEACGAAHYWAREFKKLGHEVKMMPPQYVKPYVKTNKTDAADAEAISEAVTRKNMRFVPDKSIASQDIQSMHRARKRLVRNKTSLINEMRGLLMEYGVFIPKAVRNFNKYMPDIMNKNNLTNSFKETLQELYEEYQFIKVKIENYDFRIEKHTEDSDVCQRLLTIKGIGKLTASILSSIDIKEFNNGRDFAAWLGLTPRQHSSGGKDVFLGISKRGDSYIRSLLVHGARIALHWSARYDDKLSRWAQSVKERRGHNKACVALANKLARIAFSVMKNNTEYKLA